MPRLQELKLRLETGAQGTTSPVRIRINGHTLPVIKTGGGTGPNETFEGRIYVGSVVHSLELLGPDSGRWELSEVYAHFVMDQGEAYGNDAGAAVLEPGAAKNIWSTAETFSV